MPTAGKDTFSLSVTTVSLLLLSVFSSLHLHAIIIIFFSQSPSPALHFLSSSYFVLRAFPFCLFPSQLSPPDSPHRICLSFFFFASVHLSWAEMVPSHMREDQLNGECGDPSFFLFKDIFLQFCSVLFCRGQIALLTTK